MEEERGQKTALTTLPQSFNNGVAINDEVYQLL